MERHTGYAKNKLSFICQPGSEKIITTPNHAAASALWNIWTGRVSDISVHEDGNQDRQFVDRAIVAALHPSLDILAVAKQLEVFGNYHAAGFTGSMRGAFSFGTDANVDLVADGEKGPQYYENIATICSAKASDVKASLQNGPGSYGKHLPSHGMTGWVIWDDEPTIDIKDRAMTALLGPVGDILGNHRNGRKQRGTLKRVAMVYSACDEEALGTLADMGPFHHFSGLNFLDSRLYSIVPTPDNHGVSVNCFSENKEWHYK